MAQGEIRSPGVGVGAGAAPGVRMPVRAAQTPAATSAGSAHTARPSDGEPTAPATGTATAEASVAPRARVVV